MVHIYDPSGNLLFMHTPEEFRKLIGGSHTGFVSDHIKKYNDYHGARGNRATLVTERGGKVGR